MWKALINREQTGMSMLAHNAIFLRIALILRVSHASRVLCLARRVLLCKGAQAGAGAGAGYSSVCTELRNEETTTANVERELLGYIVNMTFHYFTLYVLFNFQSRNNKSLTLEPIMAQAGISDVTGDYIHCPKQYLARLHTLTVHEAKILQSWNIFFWCSLSPRTRNNRILLM